MYGLIPNRRMPAQDTELVRRLALRYLRAADPHQSWARTAKECVNFLEGRQWTPEQIAEMRRNKRTTLTINRIAALYRLVMGYQSSNRMDISFLAQDDALSTDSVSKVLSNLAKTEGNRMDLAYHDTEVFSDGMTTGRGWWDLRLDFTENDLGEMVARADDPFSIYVDPDAQRYDLQDAAYIQESRWVSIEQIGDCYGKQAAETVKNLISPNYNSYLLAGLGFDEIAPARFFGQFQDDKSMNWNDVFYTDFVDYQAKRLRLIDTQYMMTSVKPCFVDLETGDFEPIPDEWLPRQTEKGFDPNTEGAGKIEKCMLYAEKLGNPMRIVERPVRRVRWSVQCGDVLIFDAWSPYKTYTKVPFFPYFRRGVTRGMIEDLLDPQREINKKRSSIQDILNRNANSGWMYHENALDPEQEENLRRFGAMPGINLKYKNVPNAGAGGGKPERIEPGNYPQGLDRLEEKAGTDMFQISGINESALGQLDRVQSGKAIEARQRQAVLAIQPYQDNFSRSKKLVGRKMLEIFQNHYTEPRMYRLLGEDGAMTSFQINQKKMTGTNGIERINDITVGKYSVVVDEVPISATFKQAQFEETIELLEKLGPVGQALVQTNPGLLVDMTSLPRKEEWKQSLQQALQATAAAATAVDPATGQPIPPPPGATPGGPVGPASVPQQPTPMTM